MENTWYLPLRCTVWEFLIAFFEAECRRKIPRKKSRELGVNTKTCKHVHLNLCCPVCTHQTDIKAGWKELTCSRANQLSLSCSPLRFQLQISLLMSVPKLVRPRWTRKCAELQGGVQVGPPETGPSWRGKNVANKGQEQKNMAFCERETMFLLHNMPCFFAEEWCFFTWEVTLEKKSENSKTLKFGLNKLLAVG